MIVRDESLTSKCKFFFVICLLTPSQTNASCPQDRKAFTKVLVRMTMGSEEVEREVMIKKQESEVVLIPETDNPTYCEVILMYFLLGQLQFGKANEGYWNMC